MTYLQLTKNLLIGQQAIDEQHGKLFSIANKLVDAIADGHAEEVLKKTFDELKEYVKYHFREEEAFMKKIGYPKYDAHCAHHALLVARTSILHKMLEDGKAISPESVANFVGDWITRHIMEDDAAIADFIENNK